MPKPGEFNGINIHGLLYSSKVDPDLTYHAIRHEGRIYLGWYGEMNSRMYILFTDTREFIRELNSGDVYDIKGYDFKLKFPIAED